MANVLPCRGKSWDTERLGGLLEVSPGAENRPEGPSALVGSWSPGATLPRVAIITFQFIITFITFKSPSEALEDALAHPWDKTSHSAELSQ